ncbi:MAG: sulfatase-like hydrolase/transferase [Verrucomicrobiae bacterium]|nr:sulfatase-like hydrolase/transferase [Verrucomicrobiae bacterium]
MANAESAVKSGVSSAAAARVPDFGPRSSFVMGHWSLAILLITVGFSGVSIAAPSPRPNVLFVVSDDLSSRITPAGYEGVMTPVLDRLAGQATTFQRAYCQYPVCGPSRASFLSGLYPQTTGILDNTTNIEDVRPGTPSLPGVFRQAGYWTAAVGKVFHKPLENPGRNTWDRTLAFENDETVVERAAREKFEKANGPVDSPKNRKAWKEHLLTVAPQTRNQGVKGLGPGYGPTGLRDEQHSDGKNARQVASWITGRANGDRPFLIACGFDKPHIPLIAPDAYFAKYPLDSIQLSRSPANDWDDIPAIAATKQYLDYGFPALGQEDDARRRQFMQAYHACVSFIDAQLGIIVDALHQSGQWENTIIVFVGDHGYHLGEHHMWGKVLLFEESARLPMIVRVPGMTKGASAGGWWRWWTSSRRSPNSAACRRPRTCRAARSSRCCRIPTPQEKSMPTRWSSVASSSVWRFVSGTGATPNGVRRNRPSFTTWMPTRRNSPTSSETKSTPNCWAVPGSCWRKPTSTRKARAGPARFNHATPMNTRSITRRTALKNISLAAVTATGLPRLARAAAPAASAVTLGLDAHSVRGMKWTAVPLIEYAASQKLGAVLLNGFHYFESLDDAHLKLVKALADSKGVQIRIGAGGVSRGASSFKPTYGSPEEAMITGIRVAKALGSPTVNCRIGAIADRYTPGGIRARIAEAVATLKAIKSARGMRA